MLSSQRGEATLLAVAAMAVAFLLTSAACSEPATSDQDSAKRARVESTRPPIAAKKVTRHVTIGSALWPIDNFDTLTELVGRSGLIVMGRVTTSTDISTLPIPGNDPSEDEHEDDPDFPPPGHPKYGLPTPDPSDYTPSLTRYAVEVQKVISGSSVRGGDTIPVIQSGGVKDGVAYETEGNPVIEVGATYLLFLVQEPTVPIPWYRSTMPWGRFALDGAGRLQPVHQQWSDLPVVKELERLPQDVAVAKIAAVVAAP